VAPSRPGTPYPLISKPVELLRRILRIAAGSDALVLDPFAGSGTTAQAVLEQDASDGGHRRFVLIEADDYSVRTLIPRRLAEVPGGPNTTSTPSCRTTRSPWSVLGPSPRAHSAGPPSGTTENAIR